MRHEPERHLAVAVNLHHDLGALQFDQHIARITAIPSRTATRLTVASDGVTREALRLATSSPRTSTVRGASSRVSGLLAQASTAETTSAQINVRMGRFLQRTHAKRRPMAKSLERI